jgi:hypothetical protein
LVRTVEGTSNIIEQVKRPSKEKQLASLTYTEFSTVIDISICAILVVEEISLLKIPVTSTSLVSRAPFSRATAEVVLLAESEQSSTKDHFALLFHES